MKSPEKTPPAENAATTSTGNEPTIQVTEVTAADNIASALPPPGASTESGGAIGTAIWYSDKRVNGLYTTYNAHNSWMSITGLGWQHLATSSDSACEAMTVLAAHAREKSCRIDYSVDAGIVNEMYIW